MLFTSSVALVYFLHALDIIGLIAAFLIATIIYAVWKKQIKEQISTKVSIKNSKYFWFFSLVSLTMFIFMVIMAAGNATDKAIISP